MGTSYRLTVAFIGFTLTAGAFACPIAEQDAALELTSPAITLTAEAFACPVTMKDATLTDGVPVWLSGVAVNEVVAISGTAFAVSGIDTDIIDAWGTLPLVSPATLVSPANGGHNDASDNGVYSIDLMQDAPAWSTQIAASDVGDRTANASHYADGKPGSRHGYHHAHYISQRSRVMLFGARGRYSDGGDNFTVDGHTVSGTWAWDAAGEWTAVLSSNSFGGAHDPTTGNVLTDNGRIWTQSTDTWAVGSAFAGVSWRWPIVYWPDEDCYFALHWRDGQDLSGADAVVAWRVNKTTAAVTAVTFNSSDALTQFIADRPKYCGMDWDAPNGRFLFYEGRGSGTQRIYVVTPNSGDTWDMSVLTTTGAALAAGPSSGAGINGRFRYIAALGGFAWMPRADSDILFLRTH